MGFNIQMYWWHTWNQSSIHIPTLWNKLCDLFIKYLSNGINSLSKLDIHTSFKSRLFMEIYLNEITNRADWVSYTKMIISIHRLAFETGSYENSTSWKIRKNWQSSQLLQTRNELQFTIFLEIWTVMEGCSILYLLRMFEGFTFSRG